MKVLGIIVEANPLHNGHLYFLKQIKTKFKPDVIIAITSTYFSMRGDISVLNKTDKINLLLENGVDIVLELPFLLTMQSADHFAEAAISILNAFKITDLAFGSESDDLNLYQKVYALLAKNNDYNHTISQKQNFNTLIDQTSTLTDDEKNFVKMPNFTLGLQYYKTILDHNFNIKCHLIKRIANNYHDLIPKSNIASATSIRNLIKNYQNPTNYIFYDKDYLIDLTKAENNLMLFIKYYLKTQDHNLTYFAKEEGLSNYIRKNGHFDGTLDELVNQLKNKKYTISTIKRCILHNLIETTTPTTLPSYYLRLLGINKKGATYVSCLPKETKALIFSKPKDLTKINDANISTLLSQEIKASILYQTITDTKKDCNIEYNLPIRKEL